MKKVYSRDLVKTETYAHCIYMFKIGQEFFRFQVFLMNVAAYLDISQA